jgi:hypothetical protein
VPGDRAEGFEHPRVLDAPLDQVALDHPVACRGRGVGGWFGAGVAASGEQAHHQHPGAWDVQAIHAGCSRFVTDGWFSS